MLYNIELKKVERFDDCYSCPHFDNTLGRCDGMNKCCFEYDEKTQTCIDGITKLPINIKGEQ